MTAEGCHRSPSFAGRVSPLPGRPHAHAARRLPAMTGGVNFTLYFIYISGRGRAEHKGDRFLMRKGRGDADIGAPGWGGGSWHSFPWRYHGIGSERRLVVKSHRVKFLRPARCEGRKGTARGFAGRRGKRKEGPGGPGSARPRELKSLRASRGGGSQHQRRSEELFFSRCW